jgi:MFS family permease
MALPLDSNTITHGIQLAVAPVFLLTAVAGMIGAVAGRLARIIDRARLVEERARTSDDADYLARATRELGELRLRGRLANGCIALLTSCAFLIGLTIILLFLGETTAFQSDRWAVGGFLAGVVCFLLALLCFLTETVIATRLLNFHLLSKG